MVDLVNVTLKIMGAQTSLKEMFGEEGYKLLIRKMKEKTPQRPTDTSGYLS